MTTRNATNTNAGPLQLANIRVIDLSRMAPGGFCTMMLGDFGADVIRVEEPGGGRIGRARMGRSDDPDEREERRRAAFTALNRNKRSITLNLKVPQARDVLRRLCENADVFVEGFRPGVAERLGCDYETLSALNPRLVYCSISGYGQDGPYKSLVGHDINYISTGGALGMIGSEGGPPTIPYNLVADYAGGAMQAAIGILSALMARHHTGRGQYVDISMSDGVAYMLVASLSEYFNTGAVPQRGLMSLNGGVPYYNVFECKDGKFLSLGCIEPWFWDALCRAIGREEFIEHQFDADKYPEIFDAFREVFKTRTRDDWWDYLRASGDVAVGRVFGVDELADDPQLRHRGMVQDVGEIDGVTVRQVGIGPKLSETPGSVRRLGPHIGQHTDEVLAELGYVAAEIASARETGALG